MNDFINTQEIMQRLGVGKSTAYNIISKLNKELQEKGYLTVRGKVSRKYFMERYYQ